MPWTVAAVPVLFPAYCVTLLAFGAVIGMLGPILPQLARTAARDPRTLGWLLTLRSLGQMLGVARGGAMLGQHPAWAHTFLASSLVVSAATLLLVLPALASAVPEVAGIAILIHGLALGAVDVAVNSLLPRLFGQRVRPFFLAAQLCLGLGAFVVQFVVFQLPVVASIQLVTAVYLLLTCYFAFIAVIEPPPGLSHATSSSLPAERDGLLHHHHHHHHATQEIELDLHSKATDADPCSAEGDLELHCSAAPLQSPPGSVSSLQSLPGSASLSPQVLTSSAPSPQPLLDVVASSQPFTSANHADQSLPAVDTPAGGYDAAAAEPLSQGTACTGDGDGSTAQPGKLASQGTACNSSSDMAKPPAFASFLSAEAHLNVSVGIAFALFVGIQVGLATWLPTWQLRARQSSAAAEAASSTYWACVTLGGVVMVPLANRVTPAAVLQLDCVIIAFASLLLFLLSSATSAILAAALIGLPVGNMFATLLVFPPSLGLPNRSAWIGQWMAGAAIGQMTVPWLTGQALLLTRAALPLSLLLCAMGVAVMVRWISRTAAWYCSVLASTDGMDESRDAAIAPVFTVPACI